MINSQHFQGNKVRPRQLLSYLGSHDQHHQEAEGMDAGRQGEGQPESAPAGAPWFLFSWNRGCGCSFKAISRYVKIRISAHAVV